MSLKEYRRKRKFDRTPEPPGSGKPRKGSLRFVVQKHAASRMHYDFRIELDGVLKSWAIPKGPSLSPHDTRLAVKVEDHPIEYGSFEGVIPKGNYGAGTVMIWDRGVYEERTSPNRAAGEKKLKAGLADGHITMILHGEKLRGEFALIKIKNKKAEGNAWLFVKKQDAWASRSTITDEDHSVKSGRSMEEIESQSVAKGDVWLPKKGRAEVPSKKDPALRVRPMEAVFSTSVPPGADWLFESGGKGQRAISEIRKGQVRLYSRSHLPFEKRYPRVVEALRAVGRECVLDGEIVAVGKEHRYLISDLLFLDGKDLRERPLGERRKKLSALKLKDPIRLARWSAELPKVSPSEYLFAKRADSTYRSGLSREWLRLRRSPSGSPTPEAGDKPPVTHPGKIYFPDSGVTKADLVRYYEQVAEAILPHLVDRPESLHRQPDGIRNEGFFHKDMTGFLPRRIRTVRVSSGSSGRTINYVLCQDRWSLLYLINLGCIELNPWLSRVESLDKPDYSVIDLDPDGNPFAEVIETAQEVHRVLKRVGAESFCKTSGATGIHIYVPTGGRYDYEASRTFARDVCRLVNRSLPKFTSLERNPAKRRGRIYLDFLQNARGQTLAAPYCVRPRPGATVSAPLKWTEVKPGLLPEAFTIETMPKRLSRLGDLWKKLPASSVDLTKCQKKLSKLLGD